MKNMLIFLLILISTLVYGQIATNLQFVVIENNSAAAPPNFEVKIQMNGASAFSLGSSNIKFAYNNAALGTPTLVTAHDYSGTFYAAMTVTEPVGGIVSINIDLFVPNMGNPVGVTPAWSDVATVGFTITDPSQTSALVFQSISAATDPTVIWQHDQATVNVEGAFAGTDVSLPVELAEFTVEDGVDGVYVNWTTESEIENLGFILERRIAESAEWNPLVDYKTDGTLMGQGTVPYPTEYEYLDKLVENGKEYEYRLADIDYNGVVTYHATRFITVNNLVVKVVPDKFELFAAYPNPFNPYTNISFDVPETTNVKINIYNQLGQLVRSLQNSVMQPGSHTLIWDAKDTNGQALGAGVYLYHIEAGDFSKTQKIILLK